jgi:hypothetical protein
MYSPLLGRFLSADTIVPNYANPQLLNRFSYAIGNPLKYKDPSGHWLESAIDIAFIAYDIHDISQNGLNWENGLSLAADVGGLLLPVVTGGGLAVRGGSKLLTAANHAENAAQVGAKAKGAFSGFDKIGNAVKQVKDGSCLSACGEMILKKLGKPGKQQDILKSIGEWASPNQLVTELNKFDEGGNWVAGAIDFGNGVSRSGTAQKLSQMGQPWVAIGRNPSGTLHAVVVDGFNSDTKMFRLFDPSDGHVYDVTEDFFLNWWVDTQAVVRTGQ